MIDFSSLLYAPIYEAFGVPARILCLYDAHFEITVIDKTSGVEVFDGTASVKTIRPAAVMRVSELSALGLSQRDLEGVSIEFSGKIWRVKATMLKPAPTGEAGGELYLFLIEDES
ncbi:hypothetical protein [Hyphomonas sp.]|uniref:hypothetical protein n=1 Tax=Hyphomonas sp. TaxID=87 RepID=UPI0025C0F388|nr:hypothetical protein [Hyphomonas sp.]